MTIRKTVGRRWGDQGPPKHWGTRKYQERNDRAMGMICAPLVFGLAYVSTTLVLLVCHA